MLVPFSSHIAHCNHSCDKVLEQCSFTLISMAFIYVYIYIYNYIYCINIYTYILIIQIRTYIATCTVHTYIRMYVAQETLLYQYSNCVSGCSVQMGVETLKRLSRYVAPCITPQTTVLQWRTIIIYHTRLLIHNRTGSPEPHEGERASTCVHCWGRPTLGPHVFLLCCELLSESLSLSEVILPLPSNRANSSVI